MDEDWGLLPGGGGGPVLPQLPREEQPHSPICLRHLNMGRGWGAQHPNP